MIELRASAASTWLTCSLQATMKMISSTPDNSSEEQVGMDRPPHVATQLGSLVHEKLTGQPAPEVNGIAFDAITRNKQEMLLQVDMMVDGIKEKIADHWILHREKEMNMEVSFNDIQVKVSGHIDLVIKDEHDTISIVDIKTGRMDQRSAWSQMAIYAWLLKQSQSIKCHRAVIIWAPRGMTAKDSCLKAYIETFSKSSSVLLPHADDIIKHVARAYSKPMAVPGAHCKYCDHIECEFNPEQVLPG